jgi:NAD(P)-dependent dehydrogenase (short-subunit alcohol dehydrogenase family)
MRAGGNIMANSLDGRVAIVTGAARGIGRAIALRYAREGAIVVIADLLEDQGKAVVEEIAATGGRGEFTRLDVANEDNWSQLVAGVKQRHGRLDILVNNAGIALGIPTIEMKLSDFERQMAVNVTGTFLGCKHAIPLMREGGKGSIINFSSTAGLRGSPGMAGYSAAKGAVRLFTKALAKEHAKDGIRINSMHPGLVDTQLWETMNSPTAPKGGAEALAVLSARFVPLGVTGAPDDIANGALWLASDESRYVTGVEFVIDGGMTA